MSDPTLDFVIEARRPPTSDAGSSASAVFGAERRLAAWQEHLHAHFESLAAERRTSGWPVFALEHGLTAAEVHVLECDVRASVAQGPPSREVPLPWVVYAAEFGYRYRGDEYWPTFTSETPGWQDIDAWRQRVRRAFQEFAHRYHGAAPDGKWAEQFNIIAWPITHGILPCDLQRQLAEVLYDACLTFNAGVFSSAEVLGRHLRRHSAHRSARFRKFAENTALLGQIAAALLLQDERIPGQAAADVILLPETLDRLASDLTSERDAQDWLNAARAAARLRVRGLGKLTAREATRDGAIRKGSDSSGTDKREVDQARARAYTPKFSLRETVAGVWRVWLEFPNLSPLIDMLPSARDVLMRTQGRVPGAPLLASGRIVKESRPSVLLSEWPSSQTTLLEFAAAPPELRAVLDAAFRGPPGDSWLFRIAADGQAHQIHQRLVHPGASYILLRSTPASHPAAGLACVTVECTAVYGLRLDVPENVPETLRVVLGILDLGVSRTLDVWPAGLPIPAWGGYGTGEWLNGEPVMLGFRVDHPIESVFVSVDGAAPQPTNINQLTAGQSAFVILGPLPEGRHSVVIGVRTLSDVGAPPDLPDNRPGILEWGTQPDKLSGALDVLVRAPRQLDVARVAYGAVSFSVHPEVPTLEDVWDGRCEWHLAVPGAHKVSCRVELFERGIVEPVWQCAPFELRLPLGSAAWNTVLTERIRRPAAPFYDAAHECRIEFDAGHLGRVTVVAERDFTPLRWVARDAGRRAQLLDLGGAASVSVCIYNCDAPGVSHPVDVLAAARGLMIGRVGALLCAQSDDAVAAMVVIPAQNLTSLAELPHRPDIPAADCTAVDLSRLVHAAARWEAGRLSANSLAETCRDYAVSALSSCIFSTLGGPRWANAEAGFIASGDATRAATVMRLLVSDRKTEGSIGPSLGLKAIECWDAEPAARIRIFGEVLAAFLGTTDPILSTTGSCADVFVPDAVRNEFALRLASSPLAAVAWLTHCGREAAYDSEVRLRGMLDLLLAKPVVARAARHFVLAIEGEVARHPAKYAKTVAWVWA